MSGITVKEVGSEPAKSQQEIEAELLAKQEAEQKAKEEAAAEGGAGDPETLEINNDTVLSYIRENYEGVEADSLEALLSKPEPVKADLPEELQPYLEYKKETGRGLQDYIKLNQSFDDVPDTQLLRKYYESQNPGLDADDIDFIMKKKFEAGEDADDDDKRELGIRKKNELAKAKEHFDGLKEKYKAPVVSTDGGTPGEAEKQLKAYQDKQAQELKTGEERFKFFQDETAKVFNDQFEGFEFKIGEDSAQFKSGEAKSIMAAQSDLNNFLEKFLDSETGKMKDPVGYHKAINAAMNSDELAQFFYEKGKADAVLSGDAKAKNLNKGQRQATGSLNRGGTGVKAISAPSKRGLSMK
jgi:hypothetical protein